jgi:hypothetical protein
MKGVSCSTIPDHAATDPLHRGVVVEIVVWIPQENNICIEDTRRDPVVSNSRKH